jgi:hypothetical protein
MPTNDKKPAKGRQTTEQKLNAARVRVAQLEALLREEQEKSVDVGDEVVFRFGRAGIGGGPRNMRGTVAGVVNTSQGMVVAVTVNGDLGLPDIKRVNIKSIISTKRKSARTPRYAGEMEPAR